MKEYEGKIDIEPTWDDIIKGIEHGNIELTDGVISQLYKLANIGDTLRQAQKDNITLKINPKGNVLKIYPDGTVEGVE